ncbi:MAG: NAD(P)-binding protein [Paludibacteraceae bacterium]|nr:NAD(P)-binding protein [Paludibacteraceae bacterium]
MNKIENLILGAGIAGLGAAYALRKEGQSALVVEKDATYGGLCGDIEIDGFRFDRFVHFTFTQNEEVNAIFKTSCRELIRHIPNPYNIYQRLWIKHPAQNNLFPLDEEEKAKIIQDFKARPEVDATYVPKNYEEWLRVQFGNYFAEHFPMVYTKKYWMKEAKDLRTEWVGNRVYQPSLDEVIIGSQTAETPITYYAKEMRYPQKGGYKALLKSMADVANIEYGMCVTEICPIEKRVRFANGREIEYGNIYSSLPLPVVIDSIKNVPDTVRDAVNQLECTSGYHISVALRTKNIPPYLWWYIYDEDILAARVYSPSLKSPDNVPEGCSSLQMEVYCKENEYTEQELIDGTVGKLLEMGIIKLEDILFTHVGFEKYANILFTEPIYRTRKIVRDWLTEQGIVTFGRFGEWDYLWSDQSLLSGLNILSN